MSVNEVKPSKAAKAFVVMGSASNPHSKTFAIGDEDHTIGNALRHVLINDTMTTTTHNGGGHPVVTFAGYSVPHPSEPVVHVRVQTSKESNVSAIGALQSACQTLSDQCDHVLDVLEKLLPHVKDDRIQIEQALMEEDVEEEEYDEDEQDKSGADMDADA